MKKIIAVVLAFVMCFGFAAPAVFASTANQDPVQKNGSFYSAVSRFASNSSANKGLMKVSANKSSNKIMFEGEQVGDFYFDKNANVININITKDVTVNVEWHCSKYYAQASLNGIGVYSLPQLLQDNGKTQSFDQIWILSISRNIPVIQPVVFDITVYHRIVGVEGAAGYLVYPEVGEYFESTDEQYVGWLNDVDGFEFFNLWLAANRNNLPADPATVAGYVASHVDGNDNSGELFTLTPNGTGKELSAHINPVKSGSYTITFWYIPENADTDPEIPPCAEGEKLNEATGQCEAEEADDPEVPVLPTVKLTNKVNCQDKSGDNSCRVPFSVTEIIDGEEVTTSYTATINAGSKGWKKVINDATLNSKPYIVEIQVDDNNWAVGIRISMK